jgi:hypothetical protein
LRAEGVSCRRAIFGLGKAARAETVEVQWPSEQRQVFGNVDADKFRRIEEGREQLGLQGFAVAHGGKIK